MSEKTTRSTSKKLVSIIMFSMLLFFTNGTSAQNIISFDKFKTYPNKIISVDVILENSDTVEGFQLPLTFSKLGEGFKCDSISFKGSRVENYGFVQSELFNENHDIFIGVICNVDTSSNRNPLMPGTGRICRLYFTMPDKIICKDSEFFIGKGRIKNGWRDYGFFIWTPDAEEVSAEISVFKYKFEQ